MINYGATHKLKFTKQQIIEHQEKIMWMSRTFEKCMDAAYWRPVEKLRREVFGV